MLHEFIVDRAYKGEKRRGNWAAWTGSLKASNIEGKKGAAAAKPIIAMITAKKIERHTEAMQDRMQSMLNDLESELAALSA